MIGSQVLSILKNDEDIKQIHSGVFSSDTIPSEVVCYPTAYIVNTDDSNSPGQHWVAFFYETKSKIPEYFDSYGFLPLAPSFYRVLPNQFKYSSHRIQGWSSKVCGHYCLYFIKERCKKRSMQEIISSFTYDAEFNDEIVMHYHRKHFLRNAAVNTHGS